MKFFNWMKGKFNGGGDGNKMSNADAVTITSQMKKEPQKEEFSDWPNGLLAIGTFGDIDLRHKQNKSETEIEEQCSSPDFSDFTSEEVIKLQKDLTELLKGNKNMYSKSDDSSLVASAELPLDRFLNCPSSLEVNRTVSKRFSTYSDDRDHEAEEDEIEIDRTIRIILERCKYVCEKKMKKDIGKKSLSFLAKKMFVFSGRFVPTSVRDTFQESRMEKLLRTMLAKKIYPQNTSRASSTKQYLQDHRHHASMARKEDDESNDTNRRRSKWDRTDTEYIVLEI